MIAPGTAAPVRALAEGNAAVDHALDTTVLWNEFSAHLQAYIRRRVRSPEDAEDVLQDVFVRIHENLSRLGEVQNLAAWIYRLTSNAVVDHYRRHARGDSLRDAVERESQGEVVPPFDEDDDTAQRLSQCLEPFVHRLSEPYREALLLTDLGGMTQVEAATKLGVSVSGMKSRVQRARTQLRGLVQDCCHIVLDGRGGVVDYHPHSSRREKPSKPGSCNCDGNS